MEAIGKQIWAQAEGFIPGWSTGRMTSHETACLLNTSDNWAHVGVTVFFKDREPMGPFEYTVPPRRTQHVRFNDMHIPPGTEYASVVQSDVPIVVQYTRLDSRQAELAVMSTVAYAER